MIQNVRSSMDSPRLLQTRYHRRLASTREGEPENRSDVGSRKTPSGPSRSADAPWGPRHVDRTERRWAGTSLEVQEGGTMRPWGNSARGTSPRGADSWASACNIRTTSGLAQRDRDRGASRKVLPHSPAKRAGGTNVIPTDRARFLSVRYSRLGCMHFDTPGGSKSAGPD